MLNPKKPKEFIPQVAKELNVSEQLVNSIIDFYWKKIKQSLLTCELPNVKIAGLGTFKAKHWKLPDLLYKYEMIEKKYKALTDNPETASFQKFAILKETEQRLEILNKLKVLVDQDQEKEKQIKHKRYVAKTKNNMEEQSSDMGGVCEQNNIQEDD